MMADANVSLRRLSGAGDLEVAADDHDVRGWDVRDVGGQTIGEVEDLIVDTSAMKVRYLEVDLDRTELGIADDRRVLIPIAAAQLDADDEEVIVNLERSTLAGLPTFEAISAGDGVDTSSTWTRDARERTLDSTQRITRAAEELRIGKRTVAAGEVRVGKHVETERVRQPVTLEEERVVIERRPVTGDMRADATIGETRDGDIIVPVVEEELVVEKRPVVKEELVIGKERVARTETVETDVRREEFDIENTGKARVTERTAGRSARQEDE
jgi:uncharacterized protein (TIGR02271 family)